MNSRIVKTRADYATELIESIPYNMESNIDRVSRLKADLPRFEIRLTNRNEFTEIKPDLRVPIRVLVAL